MYVFMCAYSKVESWDANSEIFESKYANNLQQLNNGIKISNNPKLWKCEVSGDTHNLWLNLSTGFIGGGRRNWDGSGGSGAALQHYIVTGRQYPLCVKLGTITPHGADVWSYADDEDTLVKDSKLAEHLAHWGIDIMSLEKTDKSLTEMEVEMNSTYDWSKICAEGTVLESVSGAGKVGLLNIGSSCYINSVMQVIVSLPEVLHDNCY
jgi:ubiquitin carboxyl-terminal hydrolase 5/13